MTRETIIEIIERAFERELHWEAKATDELFELIEQAKKEQAKEILQNLKEYIAYETKPYIKWGSDNLQDELPDACINFDILNNKIDEIAKEYEVEL